MRIRERYKINKEAKVGDKCICPSCGNEFVKQYVHQAFCKTKPRTVCKDKYWNTITPQKRNNTTRISPASAAYYENHIKSSDYYYDDHGDYDPGDSEYWDNSDNGHLV